MLVPLPDPRARVEFAGTFREMDGAASHLKAIAELRSNRRVPGPPKEEEAQREVEGDTGTAAAPKGRGKKNCQKK